MYGTVKGGTIRTRVGISPFVLRSSNVRMDKLQQVE